MEIKFLPYQPHSFAFGGFEIQMLSTFNAIKQLGLNVNKLDVWDRDDNFDILHCWGLDMGNYENVYWAKRANKKVVVTALLNYYESNIQKFKFYLSSLIYKQRLIKEMLPSIDMVVVVNDKQAEVCRNILKIPNQKVSIIPNVVDDKFFNYKQSSNSENPYILAVGNICNRKNQVSLAKSCLEAKIPLLLIGKVLNGEEKYADELNNIIKQSNNITWIKGLKENSDELIKYFANCTALALPSFAEQQPIALLEAAVLRKPLIIADRAYARQKYYNNSQLVNPDSISSIKTGLKNVMDNPVSYIPDIQPLLECKSANVANAYSNVYHRI